MNVFIVESICVEATAPDTVFEEQDEAPSVAVPPLNDGVRETGRRGNPPLAAPSAASIVSGSIPTRDDEFDALLAGYLPPPPVPRQPPREQSEWLDTTRGIVDVARDAPDPAARRHRALQPEEELVVDAQDDLEERFALL